MDPRRAPEAARRARGLLDTLVGIELERRDADTLPEQPAGAAIAMAALTSEPHAREDLRSIATDSSPRAVRGLSRPDAAASVLMRASAFASGVDEVERTIST
jgi:hypothetical protein